MVTNISVTDLLKMGDQVHVIDIRTPISYNNNHIPNAKNIESSLLINNPNKYLDKNTRYYIYCQKGIRSYKVCLLLNALGYKTVNVLGGYESWILEK